MDLKSRILSLSSTFLGVASAAVIALQASLKCEVSLTDFGVWLPAVGLAIWGALIKGEKK